MVYCSGSWQRENITSSILVHSSSPMICDNVQNTHNPQVLNEDNNAIWVLCTECGAQERIGKDKNGNPEQRAYSEFFKRELLQPGPPLYYKYTGAKEMRVA